MQTPKEGQTLDVWFRPDPAKPRSRIHSLPILRSMAREDSVVQVFHETPSVHEILRCIGMRQSLVEELRRENGAAKGPMLWIVSSGCPRAAIRSLGLVPMRRWPRGLYTAASGFRLRLVVVSELDRTPDSLMLRLLGTGQTFRDALHELENLPATAWEVRRALPLLMQYRQQIETLPPSERTTEEKAILAAGGLYRTWQREGQGDS